MDKREIFDICRGIGQKLKVDPCLIMAIIEQESTYKDEAVRLEPGFYRKYTKPQNLATTTEVLLAASYGLMQMMGQSLSELGYFKEYADSRKNSMLPLSQINVVKAIDDYMINEAVQIETGVRWFLKKLDIAKGDVRTALGYWNGDKTGKYAGEVLDRYNRMKKSGGMA